MNILDKIVKFIDRDKVVTNNNIILNQIEYHDIVRLTCDRCKAPKLYRIGTDTSYTLHCFVCDKIDSVVSL